MHDKRWPGKIFVSRLEMESLKKKDQESHLFPCADAPVNLLNNAPVDHFKQNNASARIKNLFISGTIRFVTQVCSFARSFSVGCHTTHPIPQGVWNGDICNSGIVFCEKSELLGFRASRFVRDGPYRDVLRGLVF